MNQNSNEHHTHGALFTTTIVLLLLAVTPPAAVLLVHTHIHLDGSVAKLWTLLTAQGIKGFIPAVLSVYPSFNNFIAWKIIGYYALIEAVLMTILPGKRFLGPVAVCTHIEN